MQIAVNVSRLIKSIRNRITAAAVRTAYMAKKNAIIHMVTPQPGGVVHASNYGAVHFERKRSARKSVNAIKYFHKLRCNAIEAMASTHACTRPSRFK